MQAIHNQGIYHANRAGDGCLHIFKTGEHLPRFPLVEKTEIQPLDMAIETGLEIKTHPRPHVLAKKTAQGPGKPEKNRHTRS